MGDTSRQGRERERSKNTRASFKCLIFSRIFVKVIVNETPIFHIISPKKVANFVK